MCESCEQPLAPHQGPGVPPGYEFPLFEVALALHRVGRGMSYTEAAVRAQVRSEREKRVTPQLVANWVEVFAPVVAAEWAEPAWPETVVLDSKPMFAPGPGNRNQQVFTVLAAYGYEQSGAGRLVSVQAYPGSVTASDWAGFLGQRAGTPAMVITDHDNVTIGGIRQAFPTAVVRLCRFHLKRNIEDKLRATVGSSSGHPLAVTGNSAFKTFLEWEDFTREVHAYGKSVFTRWHRLADPLLRADLTTGGLPDHWSNGAVEAALRDISAVITPRAFALRNRERTNRALELIRLNQNKTDDIGEYVAAIRNHLLSGAPISHQGAIRDTTRVTPAGQRIHHSSLR